LGFLFYSYSLLIAIETNTSVAVKVANSIHFNLDNKEYSFTLENREKKTKAKERAALRSASNRSFATKFS